MDKKRRAQIGVFGLRRQPRRGRLTCVRNVFAGDDVKPSTEVTHKLNRDLETIRLLFNNFYLLDNQERKKLYQSAVSVDRTVRACLKQLEGQK